MSKRVPSTSGEPPVKKRAPRKVSTDEICPDDLQALFGRNFQIARQKKNLTLRDVAAATGMVISSISRIERGGTNLTIETMKRLAAVVGVDARELMGPLPGVETPPAQSSKK